MSALSQKYDQAQAKLSQVDQAINTTKAAIAANKAEVSKDKSPWKRPPLRTRL